MQTPHPPALSPVHYFVHPRRRRRHSLLLISYDANSMLGGFNSKYHTKFTVESRLISNYDIASLKYKR